MTEATLQAAQGAVSRHGGERWLASAQRLDAWMACRDYAGYDPHDLLSAAPVRALTFGNRLLGMAWTQLGKRAPVQLRPLVGVRPVRNPKGIGLALAAHARLFEATGDSAYAASACGFVRWLAGSSVEHGGGRGWGYPFPWSNRDFHAPAGTPASVPTAFIAHALLDAAEAWPALPWSREAGELAISAGRFIAGSLHRTPGRDDAFCFSYTPVDQRAVHNASVLSASVLARLVGTGPGAWSGAAALPPQVRQEWTEAALGAAHFTLQAQRTDGSWPYGAGGRDAWVDSFHTSYVLVSLAAIGRALPAAADGCARAVDLGLRYWRDNFFAGPAVGYYPGAPYPVDTHAVAHAILTFIELEHSIPDAVAEAERLADWCLQEMQDPQGYFYYQKHRLYRNRLPYMRWTQAWMLLALTRLAARLRA